MDLDVFIEARRPAWKRLESVLARVEGSGLGCLSEEQAVEFGQLYRGTASDLNQAQTFISGDTTVEYLNDLVGRCYVVIYGKSKADVWGLLRFYLLSYPAVFRRYLPHFLLALALFAAGTAFGFGAAWLDPDATNYLLPHNFPTIQPGSSGQEESAPARETGQLAAMSGFLFRNNMTVTLLAFGLGITFGIGTVWLIVSNGLMTGALATIFVRAGAFGEFATGILPHGVLEIPAMLIGGAAGLVLAQGIIRARPWPRLHELARCGKQAVFLVSGSLPLLVVAALLEAVVARAPNRLLSQDFKLATAGMAASLFLTYLVVLGRGRHRTSWEDADAAP
jgi:uncharacterized membrane protein SpoIIM required for sporulation